MANILDRLVMIAECDNVFVNTYGLDGNALIIIGACQSAMQKEGISKEVRDAFFAEATSSDYESVLKTCALWVTLVHIVPSERHHSVIGSLREFGLDPEISS